LDPICNEAQTKKRLTGFFLMGLLLLSSAPIAHANLLGNGARPSASASRAEPLAPAPSGTNSKGAVTFSVSGATFLGFNLTGYGDYAYSVDPGSTVTLTANAIANPLCCNAGYGGVSSSLNLTLFDQGSDTGTGSATSFVSGSGSTTSTSTSLALSDTYAMVGSIDFETFCGSLRGCPDTWQSELLNIYLVTKPSITLHDDARSSSASIPGTVNFYGQLEPSVIDATLNAYKGSVLNYSTSLYANSSGTFETSFDFSSPDQAGQWTFVASASNTGDALPPNLALNASATVALQVEPGASVTTESTSTSITTTSEAGVLTGQVTDPLKRAIADATVQLFWNPTSTNSADLTLIATTTTDDTGMYSFNVQYPMQGGGVIQVMLQNQYFDVEDNATFTSPKVSLLAAQFDYPVNGYLTIQSASDLHQDIHVLNTQSPPDRASEPLLPPYEDAGYLSTVYVNALNAFGFYTEYLDFSFKSAIPIIFYPAAASDYFDSAKDYIVINNKFSDDVVNREYHEIGHYMMYLTFGGSAYFNDKGTNHAGFANPDSKDSWTEAFAEFWGQTSYSYSHDKTTPTTLDPVYAWSQSVGGGSINLNNVIKVDETVRTNNGLKYQGISEEFATASIMWSLASAKDDVDGATTQLSADDLWAITTDTYNFLPANSYSAANVDRHVDTLTDLYYVLTNADVDTVYSISAAQVTKIFKAYDVFQASPDGTLQVGIDNPSGGPLPTDPVRPNRQEPDFPQGSGVLVQSSQASLPYAMAISINYGQPYQADDYVAYENITQTTQTVNIWLPDPKIYNATAALTASRTGYADLKVASLNNTFYWDNAGKSSNLMETPQVVLKRTGGSGAGGTQSDLLVGVLFLLFVFSLVVIGVRKVVGRVRNKGSVRR